MSCFTIKIRFLQRFFVRSRMAGFLICCGMLFASVPQLLAADRVPESQTSPCQKVNEMSQSSSNDHNQSHLIGSIEEYCTILHELHDSLPAHSQERTVLAVAAKALLFSMAREDFHKFLSNDELTCEQKEHLARLGIDTHEAES